MVNSADPDQLASSTDLALHCLQRQAISGFIRTGVKLIYCSGPSYLPIVFYLTVTEVCCILQ